MPTDPPADAFTAADRANLTAAAERVKDSAAAWLGEIDPDEGDERESHWRDELACAKGALRLLARVTALEGERYVRWRCFHCGDTFTEAQAAHAREHFGRDEGATPVCLMRVPGESHILTALRNAQDELVTWRAECDPLTTALHAQAADYEQRLIREEEKGYARGLKDYTKIEQERDDANAARDVADAAGLRKRLAKAEAFKTWTHQYLDTHGVPHHPPGTHGAAGCRIGDRMDWLMAKMVHLDISEKAYIQEYRKAATENADLRRHLLAVAAAGEFWTRVVAEPAFRSLPEWAGLNLRHDSRDYRDVDVPVSMDVSNIRTFAAALDAARVALGEGQK